MIPKRDRSPTPSAYSIRDHRTPAERALDKIDLRTIRRNNQTVRFDSRRRSGEYTYLNWRPWDDAE